MTFQNLWRIIRSCGFWWQHC